MTKDERIQYAYKHYGRGVKFRCLLDGVIEKSMGIVVNTDYDTEIVKVFIDENNDETIGCVFAEGEWAEIVDDGSDMNHEEAINILTKYNEWRRGDIDVIVNSSKKIGIAIDYAIEKLKRII